MYLRRLQSKEGGKDPSTHFSAELQKCIFQPMIWPYDYKTLSISTHMSMKFILLIYVNCQQMFA